MNPDSQPPGIESEGHRPWWRQPRKVLTALALVLLGLAVAGGIAYSQLKRPDDVSNPAVPFDDPAAGQTPKKKKQKKESAAVNWPTFRYDRQRTGYLPVNGIKPPFKRVWKYGDKPLLEFPPIVVKGVLYFVDNDGHAIALRSDTGKEIWKRKIARLNATSPTFADGRLYITNLEPGQVLSLNAKNGRQIWKKPLPCRSESSPVVVHRRVYFGCESGEFYALRSKNGSQVWSTSLAGAIKAAPAYENGTLFVGDYGGAFTALRASNGEIQWQTSSLGPGLGQAGAFYSTPAVAFGRVYVGNNDSRVYSFDADNGEVAWTHSTGNWVYSGPTVAKVPGTRPSVYIGSFDGKVYALDARTGDTRWTFDMGGRVIGSLSVIGKTVYAATFDGTTTYGLSAGKGQKTFTYHTGAYMPGISDGEKLYLVGYSSINALKPLTRKQIRAAKKRKAEARKKNQAKKKAARKKQKSGQGETQ